MSGHTLGESLSTRDHSTMQTIPSLPPRISEAEAKLYYAGLPSKPHLIARTGSTPWEAPTGLEAYARLKRLKVVGDHKISKIWDDVLAPKVLAILDEKQMDWSSIDVVRIGYVDEQSGPVVLWVGVNPDSQVSYEAGIDVALQCKELLLAHDIQDVEVEMRQSKVIQLAGPQFFQPGDDINPTVDFREPFTATLGMPICAQSTPWVEGTAGFFLDEGSDGKRLLLVTARHVVLPQSDNKLYEHKSDSQHCHNVVVLSDMSFQRHLASIKNKIAEQDDVITYQTRRIEMMADREGYEAIRAREDARNVVERAQEKAIALTDFHWELSTYWATDDSRILGHVIFSPPIVFGASTEQYTQDIAVINIDTTKINPNRFSANVIDLGTKFPPEKLTRMMYPSANNSHNFDYPGDRLLRLRGTITEEEMRKPTMYDQNGERCIMVIKHGRTTGLTVGRANNIFSYTRRYFNYSGVSKEWAVLPFDNMSGPFSKIGDSGSVVVDGAGRIGGLLTGGGGATDSTDVTYVTPINCVLKTIHAYKPLAKAHPKWGLSP